jgi:hypothetical protein
MKAFIALWIFCFLITLSIALVFAPGAPLIVLALASTGFSLAVAAVLVAMSNHKGE